MRDLKWPLGATSYISSNLVYNSAFTIAIAPGTSSSSLQTTLGRQSTNYMACKRRSRVEIGWLRPPDFGDVSTAIGREISSLALHSFTQFVCASKFIVEPILMAKLEKNDKKGVTIPDKETVDRIKCEEKRTCKCTYASDGALM